MGVVNILKTLSQSSGPSVTGVLAGNGHFWVAFVAAGSLKAAYDLLLLALFGGRVRPRTEAELGREGGEQEGDVVGDVEGETPDERLDVLSST
jgi:hypothetical protein